MLTNKDTQEKGVPTSDSYFSALALTIGPASTSMRRGVAVFSALKHGGKK
jgi:hypothetical protein